MEFKHKSVLLDECLEGLAIRADGVYTDGTLGGGGHSSEIIRRLDSGRLIGIDRDMDAIGAASARIQKIIEETGGRFQALQACAASGGNVEGRGGDDRNVVRDDPLGVEARRREDRL